MAAIHPVILCGGSGTRLWPTSRRDYPKQFSNLIGDESLFQMTARRFAGPAFAAPTVMTNAEFRFLATDQLAEIGLVDAEILIEPAARNTGPAILTAALRLAERDGEALMLVAPSDHVISDEAGFLKVVEAGAEAARGGALVTFGIAPDRPETGYGYLKLDGRPAEGAATPVAAFVEKPNAERAEQMIASGDHLWNAGIFLFRAADIVAAFEAHAPDIAPACRDALAGGGRDLNFFRLDAEAYGKAPDVSIDYAVMEKAEGIVAVPYSGGWSDLGSWDALWEALDGDASGVVTKGAATEIDCRDTMLRSEEDNLHIVGLGLDNIVAVAMRDAVLVADKSASQKVKEVVTALKARSAPQAVQFPQFHRPWGWYETLCFAERFQVKRIMVKPGGALSLQSHMHRSEHWVVVAGTAHVTIGEETRLVTENQSVYIPLGAVHRLENRGKLPMYLIEVQTGAYLGEDDIVRYEDVYDRM
ncbi:MAG: mannose-1-phosphate guanylyltransferase/mannose-6-phosphate isomerase [Pseudomonadota bacterium]